LFFFIVSLSEGKRVKKNKGERGNEVERWGERKEEEGKWVGGGREREEGEGSGGSEWWWRKGRGEREKE
jgi:hypothetical protein